jgi:hypothetical protein
MLGRSAVTIAGRAITPWSHQNESTASRTVDTPTPRRAVATTAGAPSDQRRHREHERRDGGQDAGHVLREVDPEPVPLLDHVAVRVVAERQEHERGRCQAHGTGDDQQWADRGDRAIRFRQRPPLTGVTGGRPP